MTLRNRFLLVGFGVFVFVVATPILVLFTRGYEIDWTNHRFVKTGVFVMKTLPTKADIFLNNKELAGKTPETVRFLLPGDYDVRIEKDGYQSWTKRLSINPQFATWINEDRDFITLFRKTADQLTAKQINFASVSNDQSEIAYVANNRLNIYNTDNQSTEDLANIADYHVPFTFTGNLVWTNGAQVLQYFNQHSNALPFDISNISKVETNGTYMVISVRDEIYLIGQSGPLLVDKKVSGSLLDGENLWYVSGNSLKEYNLRTGNTSTINNQIPANTSAKIIRGEGSTYLLLDKSLYAINDSLEKIFDGATFVNYDNNSHLLLFADPNEIYTYDPSKKTTDLIIRSLSQIIHPVLNSYTGYVFFENEAKIKAIELDGRDHRNIYSIVESPADADFTVSSDGSILTVFDSSTLTSYRIR